MSCSEWHNDQSDGDRAFRAIEQRGKEDAALLEILEVFLRAYPGGGKIIPTSKLSEMEIAWARAENRLLVLDDGRGFALHPATGA